MSSHSFAENRKSGLEGLPLQPLTGDETPAPQPLAPFPGRDGVSEPDDHLRRLGDLLIDRGLVDRRSLARAERVALDTGGRLDRVLTQLGIVSERDLAQAMSALFDAPLAAPADYPSAPLFADRLKPKFLRKAQALPVAANDAGCIVAIADPFDDFTRRAIEAALGLAVSIAVAVPIELEAALDRLYPEFGDGGGDPLLEDVVAGGEPSEEDAERLKDLASEAPVIRLVNQLVLGRWRRALPMCTSNPSRTGCAFATATMAYCMRPSRPRHSAGRDHFPHQDHGRLDIAERRLPQDGRIKITVRGQDIDFRVSTIPSLHGETVVLRILDRTAVVFDYAKLGLPRRSSASLGIALELPNGSCS